MAQRLGRGTDPNENVSGAWARVRADAESRDRRRQPTLGTEADDRAPSPSIAIVAMSPSRHLRALFEALDPRMSLPLAILPLGLCPHRCQDGFWTARGTDARRLAWHVPRDERPDGGPSGGSSRRRRALGAVAVPAPRVRWFPGRGRLCFFRELFRHHNVTECALATFQDRTGLECYVNKIHLEDFLEEGTTLDGPSLARLAVRCSRLLASHPRKKFPGRPFRIIVSVDGRVCTLRFHKIRPGELWLQDLHLVEEALLVVDFSPGAEGRS